jgi:deoxyribonuclease-4
LELKTLVSQVMPITGRIDLLHLNDSRDAFGSGADRHANLGQGQCDPDDLLVIAQAAGAPIIVETPGGVEAQAQDIAWLSSVIPGRIPA